MVCPICKNKNIESSFFIKDYEYNIDSISEYTMCKICKIIYRITNIKEEEEQLLYSKKIYKPAKGGLIYNYLKKMNAYYEKYSILKHIINNKNEKKNTVLDIACGKGYLLETFAKNDKYICYGIDLNIQNDRKNIQFIRANFKNLKNIKKINADIIIINNFIEHLENMQDLFNIINTMKKDSYMIIITPDTNSKARLFFGNCWSGYHAPRHKVLFNKNNILDLFSNSKNINLKTYKIYDPFTNIISLSNLIKEAFNHFHLKVLIKIISFPLIILLELVNKNRILLIIQKK
jgi:2-polyprenyl-3-methyl-5-hydroxy-6-metoxy-1,4-benzoquinol methylase